VKLVDDFDFVLKRAWSVRLLALSLVLSGLEVAIQVAVAFSVKPPIPAGLFAALAGVVTIAAGVARFVAQDRSE